MKEIADSLRLNRIPSDVIWMDIDYMDRFKVFTFDKKKFPDPKGLNDYLHSKGFKAVYMIDLGVKVEEGYFVDDEGSLADYWVKDKDGNPYVGETSHVIVNVVLDNARCRHCWAVMQKAHARRRRRRRRRFLSFGFSFGFGSVSDLVSDSVCLLLVWRICFCMLCFPASGGGAR